MLIYELYMLIDAPTTTGLEYIQAFSQKTNKQTKSLSFFKYTIRVMFLEKVCMCCK